MGIDLKCLKFKKLDWGWRLDTAKNIFEIEETNRYNKKRFNVLRVNKHTGRKTLITDFLIEDFDTLKIAKQKVFDFLSKSK